MKKLIPFFVSLLLAFSGIAFADLNTGLVAYYPFNGDANDYSGYNNHPNHVGAVLTTDRFGMPDSAYSFLGGTNDYIQVPNSSSINVNTFTISFWAKFADLERNHVMLDKRNGQWHRNYGLYFYADDSQPAGFPQDYLAVIIGDNTFAPTDYSNAAFWPVDLSLDEFYFIAATYDQSYLVLYLNGVPISTKLIHMPGITGPGDLFIGAHGMAPSYSGRFYGVLDEVRIYNRALSESEIAELYGGVEICNADYNNDGKIDGRDVVQMRQDLMKAAREEFKEWFDNCWLPAKLAK